jgi:hypothetical protein
MLSVTSRALAFRLRRCARDRCLESSARRAGRSRILSRWRGRTRPIQAPRASRCRRVRATDACRASDAQPLAIAARQRRPQSPSATERRPHGRRVPCGVVPRAVVPRAVVPRAVVPRALLQRSCACSRSRAPSALLALAPRASVPHLVPPTLSPVRAGACALGYADGAHATGGSRALSARVPRLAQPF